MSSKLAVRVESISKAFHVYGSPRDRLKQFVVPRLQRIIGRPQSRYYDEFWALHNISFEVEKGETVGIIGQNGSGKSTLLQIICGTLSPTEGRISCRGRIGALLELGSGFNPEFTGRENVYMNASVLGLSEREISDRFDDIVAFADIGKFIDQPVKVYSSGMMVRLAFAVQAQVDPDILIVDEALAVGDAKFQMKCFERLKQLKERGTSILLVTHSSEQIVNHCDRAVLLNSGEVVELGEPRAVVNRYLDLLFGKSSKQESLVERAGNASEAEANAGARVDLNFSADVFHTRAGYNPYEYRWGDGAAKVLDYVLLKENEAFPTSISTGQKVDVLVAVKFYTDIVRPIFGFTLKTKEGVTICGANTESMDVEPFRALGRSGEMATVRVSFNCLLSTGDYFLSIGIASQGESEIIPHDRRYDAIHLHVMPNDKFFGLADLSLNFTVEDSVQ